MFAAVDIGGTKTLVAVFDKDGKIIEEQKFPTPQHYDEFKIDLAKAVAKLSTKDLARVVCAVPGLLNRKKGIGLALGNLSWKNFHIVADAETIFKAPVMIENDAKLAALAEALELKEHKVFYLTVSTGIGGGLIIDRIIDPDFEDIEVGHMTLEHKGKYEIWEHFASGKAIVAKYGKKASEINDPDTWKVIAQNLAIGIINIIATLNPDAIVIGGGVGSHLGKFKHFLESDLEKFKTPILQIPPIYKAAHPQEAVVYGCYEYAKQHHEKLNT